MICTTESSSDFYTLLGLPRDASTSDIKIAYHRTLLLLHPDKQSQVRIEVPGDLNHTPQETVDIALLKEAYTTLSDPTSRAAYDGSLRRGANACSHGPRPAQVVSLEDFTINDGEDSESAQQWRYGCRCGGEYKISEDDLESGKHLVACESCSEVIWVGYEVAEGDE